MIINNIIYRSHGSTTTLQADVAFKGQKKETMFFTIESKYKSFLTMDASPFLAAVLLPCMKRREDIFIHGSVSSKLLKGIEKIMDLYESWSLGFQRISIHAENQKNDKNNPKYIACFFSGGVDSFYTYLQNKKEKRNKITHFILVHGFDIVLSNADFFRVVTKSIRRIAQEENIELITVKTNAGEIIESRILWDYGHGGALAAVGLCLRNQLKQVYISSAVSKEELYPYGTHPDLDKHWSTEKMQFIHEGIESNRLEKVINCISKSPLALKHLRVCCQNLKQKYNCSTCFKCLRTMEELICADALDRSKTFDKKINLKAVETVYYDNYYSIRAKRILTYLQKHNKHPQLQASLLKGLQNSKHFSLKRMISNFIAYIDRTYNDRRIYRFIFFTLNNKQDRNIYFKLLTRVGIIK